MTREQLMKKYLELRMMVRHHQRSLETAEADMDKLWYQLTDADHEYLDSLCDEKEARP
jgi:hypothetical protein